MTDGRDGPETRSPHGAAADHGASPAGLEGRECDCPADAQIARFFDRRSAVRSNAGDRYVMANVSEALLTALLRAGPLGRSVLELGCGPGAMLTELLVAGAEHGTGVDLSANTLAEARDRLEDAGMADRATLAVGDAAHLPLETHDWVVLDKVICCYPDADALLRNSIGAARRLYAFAVPSSYGWRGIVARIGIALENVTLSVLGRPCPGYVHDVRLIEGQLREAGFRPFYRGTSHTWEIAVFERAA
jgi:SAM-dependent methyltransferase